jgi:hypothetical protein
MDDASAVLGEASLAWDMRGSSFRLKGGGKPPYSTMTVRESICLLGFGFSCGSLASAGGTGYRDDIGAVSFVDRSWERAYLGMKILRNGG